MKTEDGVNLSSVSMNNKKKIKRTIFAVAVLIFIAAISFMSSIEGLVIETEDGFQKWLFTRPGKTFSLNFTHSVQLTPVVENFVITNSYTLKLESTVYQSLGVGLPFLPEEGNFRQKGNKFIFEAMNREFDHIELRPGPEARLTLIYEGIPYYLYDTLPYASLVRIRTETAGSYLIRKTLSFI